MCVSLPPQYNNDDCNGHLLKDGDNQNVSAAQFGLQWFVWGFGVGKLVSCEYCLHCCLPKIFLSINNILLRRWVQVVLMCLVEEAGTETD